MNRIRALFFAAVVLASGVGGYDLGHRISQPTSPPVVYAQTLAHLPSAAVPTVVYRQDFYTLTERLAVIKQEIIDRGIDQHDIEELTAITHKLSQIPHSIPWTPDMDYQLQSTLHDWDLSGALPEAVEKEDPEIKTELDTAASKLVSVVKHLCHG